MRDWPCRQVGVAEHLDASQNQEVTQFLDAIAQTPCIQYVHQLLVAKVCQDPHFNLDRLLYRTYCCCPQPCSAANDISFAAPAP